MRPWIPYIIAAIIVHLLRLIGWMRQQPPLRHKNVGAALWDFYFGSKDAQYITIATFGIVWIVGTMVVEHVGSDLVPILKVIPQNSAWTFTFGSLSEFIAPKLIRWLIGLLPGIE